MKNTVRFFCSLLTFIMLCESVISPCISLADVRTGGPPDEPEIVWLKPPTDIPELKADEKKGTRWWLYVLGALLIGGVAAMAGGGGGSSSGTGGGSAPPATGGVQTTW